MSDCVFHYRPLSLGARDGRLQISRNKYPRRNRRKTVIKMPPLALIVVVLWACSVSAWSAPAIAVAVITSATQEVTVKRQTGETEKIPAAKHCYHNLFPGDLINGPNSARAEIHYTS